MRPPSAARPRLWLVSPLFDVTLFTGPAFLAVLLVGLVPGATSTAAETPAWAWALFVLGVDVAHVYAALYRSYFDRAELARRPTLYALTPVACYVAGVAAYAFGPLAFWRVLAYVAVFHFVRQQYGFVALYEHRAGERDPLDRTIDRAAIYLSMLYPLVFWHAKLPRHFHWFVAGDFVEVTAAWAPTVAGGAFGAALLAFVLRQGWLLARGRANPGKVLVVLSTALSWYVGIVLFDSDFAFTATNVLAHGVPYMALVWLYCRRRAPDRAPRAFLARIAEPRLLPVFVGLLVALAFLEEGTWDVLLWRDHASIFGEWPAWLSIADRPALLALVVPLLAVPQATHYVLDAFLWRFDGSNPGLREALFGGEAAAGPATDAAPARVPVLQG
ncbi:MAG: hypothetical protein HYZ53_10195 [Planctomycetes bacterium]|nr:hypothetical protein [Planctomycetota bacterium]